MLFDSSGRFELPVKYNLGLLVDLRGPYCSFFFNLNPHERKAWRHYIQEFGLLGPGLIVSGVICVLILVEQNARP